MKIFILSPNIKTLFDDKQLSVLKRARGGLVLQDKVIPFENVKGLFDGDEDRILAIDPDFCNWSVSNTVIDKIPNLKAIVLQTTSFSWIDTDHAKSLNIPVINLRGFSSIAVAEWATMMSLCVARRIPLIVKDNWKQDYVKHKGIELRGKTAGIIGLGNIGTAIAENLQGLGMVVQYWSRNSRDRRFKATSLAQLMKTSDLILPVVAQNKETNGLITDQMLGSMKKSAIFVSIVHNVYNHELLLKLVAKDEVYGYGYEGRPEMKKFKGNVWAGPELAWCTEDSMRKNAEQWLEAIVNASKRKYPTRVN